MKKNKFFAKYSGKTSLFVLRVIIGCVFILSSINKLYDPLHFQSVISMYKIMPEVLASFFAIVLPWVEFACGVLLILNCFTKSSALILSAVLTAFIAAVTVNLARGFIHDCGCFDIFGFKEEISIIVIIRDIILLGITVFIYLKSENKGFYYSKK